MKKQLKEWWYSRWSVVDIAVGIACSGVDFRFKILGYGIRLDLEFPEFLDAINPIAVLSRILFRQIAALFGRPDAFTLWSFRKVSRYKGIECEFGTAPDILSFGYHWNMHSDHVGHRGHVALCGLECSAYFYDSRHWNYEANRPFLSVEEEQEQRDARPGNIEFVCSLTEKWQ